VPSTARTLAPGGGQRAHQPSEALVAVADAPAVVDHAERSEANLSTTTAVPMSRPRRTPGRSPPRAPTPRQPRPPASGHVQIGHGIVGEEPAAARERPRPARRVMSRSDVRNRVISPSSAAAPPPTPSSVEPPVNRRAAAPRLSDGVEHLDGGCPVQRHWLLSDTGHPARAADTTSPAGVPVGWPPPRLRTTPTARRTTSSTARRAARPTPVPRRRPRSNATTSRPVSSGRRGRRCACLQAAPAPPGGPAQHASRPPPRLTGWRFGLRLGR
jgi:hypothetical protein